MKIYFKQMKHLPSLTLFCLCVWKVHSSVNNFSATLTSQKTLIAMKTGRRVRKRWKRLLYGSAMCRLRVARCWLLSILCFASTASTKATTPNHIAQLVKKYKIYRFQYFFTEEMSQGSALECLKSLYFHFVAVCDCN